MSLKEATEISQMSDCLRSRASTSLSPALRWLRGSNQKGLLCAIAVVNLCSDGAEGGSRRHDGQHMSGGVRVYGVKLIGPTWEESDERSICDSSRLAGGFYDWRRRRSGSSRSGRAPAYVVTEVGISDLDAYQREYVPLAQASIKASGGHLVAAGQNFLVLDGPSPGTRVAINQFESLDAVQVWRNSDQFKDARKIGDKYAKFSAFAIEGLPQ